MFCNNCGQPVEEGKAFCKACGVPVAAASAGAGGSPAQAPPMRQAPPAQPPAFVPPPATQAPPPGYAPGWAEPQPPRKTGGRGGLIAGIVAAVIIVLAGAGVGVYFGLIRDDGEAKDGVAVSTSTTHRAGASTSTLGAASTSGATGTTSGTTLTSGSTVQTIPSLNTTTSRPATTTTEDTLNGYLMVTDELVAELEADDARIPELATKINANAPKVPEAVQTELQGMADRLDAFTAKLYAFAVPPGFEESFGWLDEATQYMASRIGATIAGIEVMRSTGKISSADDFFNQGRIDRDAYRKAIAMFRESVPVD